MNTPVPPHPPFPLPRPAPRAPPATTFNNIQYNCDTYWSNVCLSDDRSETLEEAKGVAPGAKLAILDLGSSVKLDQVLGGPMWDAAAGTGARLHSASWGFPDDPCTVDEASVSFDEWAFEVRKGQEGRKDRRKNVRLFFFYLKWLFCFLWLFVMIFSGRKRSFVSSFCFDGWDLRHL